LCASMENLPVSCVITAQVRRAILKWAGDNGGWHCDPEQTTAEWLHRGLSTAACAARARKRMRCRAMDELLDERGKSSMQLNRARRLALWRYDCNNPSQFAARSNLPNRVETALISGQTPAETPSLRVCVANHCRWSRQRGNLGNLRA
jgi:hypothetical protein